MFYVSCFPRGPLPCALSSIHAAWAPQSPPPCRHTQAPTTSRPAACPAPCATACKPLRSTQTSSTSPSAGTPPASRTCDGCLMCAAPRALCAPPHLQSRPTRAARVCMHAANPPPPPSALCPHSHPPCTMDALLATLGRARKPSTSPSAGTPPASGPCTACLMCAAPRPPRPHICRVAASPGTRCACKTRSAAARLLCPCPQLDAPHRCPCLRPSAERARLQPAPQLGHLGRHSHGRHVCCALLPAPCAPQAVLVAPLPSARCVHTHHGRSPPSRLPARAARPHRCVPLLAILGRARKPSTSPSAGTPRASLTWEACLLCAAPPPPVPAHHNLHSCPLPCMLRAHHAVGRHPRSSRAHPTHHMCTCFCNLRQRANKFNQPLSWDTSGVTSMTEMFYVSCFPRGPLPCALSSIHAAWAPQSPPPCRHTQAPTTSRPAACPAPCATACKPLRSTQTSSTSPSAGTPPASRTCDGCLMCAAPRALCAPPHLQSRPTRAARVCMHAANPPPPPSALCPHSHPPCTMDALLATLGRARKPSTSPSAGTPPASGPCTACLMCAAPRPPRPHICRVAASPGTRCACKTRSAAARLLCPCPQLDAPHRCPCLRPSAERARLQPAPQLGHLGRHSHGRHVCCALLPAPCAPQAVLVAPLPSARCVHTHHGRSPPSRLPARAARPHRCVPLLAILGRARKPSTSPSAGTPRASLTWEACLLCAAPRALCPPMYLQSRPLPCRLLHAHTPRSALASRLPAHSSPRTV